MTYRKEITVMLQTIKQLSDKLTSAYQNHKNGNCCQLTGDFNVSLHLHRKNTPDKAANLQTNGGGTLALIDVGIALCACLLLLPLLRGIMRFLRRI